MKHFLLLLIGSLGVGCPVVPPTEPKPQPVESCELSAPYTFYSDGMRLFQERVTISAKGEFSIARTFSSGKTASCQAQISCDKGNIFSLNDLKAALSNPDVEKAFTAGIDFYGEDGRPRDIPALIIEGPKGKLQIGQACTSTLAGCVAIPAGVAALAELLRGLREQYAQQGDCATLPGS